MSFTTILGLGQTALELGLMSSLTVLALFLSYTMLNVCDLSTDGCFTLGAAVGAVVALAGHPFLSIPAAMLAGVISGFVTAFLQTRMGVNSLLAGIVVNTALYSINIAVMGNTSLLNMNKTETVFTKMQSALEGTFLAGQQKLAVSLIAVALVIVFLSLFLRTKLGLAIRATGNNPDMVKSSSIDPVFTTTVGLCVANAFTALSGCLLAQAQKSVNIDIGSGMVTIALASLLIGGMFFRRRGVALRAVGAVLGLSLIHIWMLAFFRISRRAGLAVAAVCIALYWPLAPQIMHAFIHDEQTVALGTVYLRARCFAPIMMFLCFHMVHYMQALGKGGVSLALAAIRQLGMNIPLLFLLDHFFGMTGIIWTQVTADALTAVISYLIYAHVKRGLEVPDGTKTEST